MHLKCLIEQVVTELFLCRLDRFAKTQRVHRDYLGNYGEDQLCV